MTLHVAPQCPPIAVAGQFVQIRPYIHEADYQNVTALWKATGTHRPGRDDPARLAFSAEQHPNDIIVAALGYQAIGAIHVDTFGDAPVLSGLAVAETYRGHGIGTALLKTAIEVIGVSSGKYAEIIIDEGEDGLEALYAKINFKRAGVYVGLEQAIKSPELRFNRYPPLGSFLNEAWRQSQIPNIDKLLATADRMHTSQLYMPAQALRDAWAACPAYRQFDGLDFADSDGKVYLRHDNFFQNNSESRISLWCTIPTTNPDRYAVIHPLNLRIDDKPTTPEHPLFGSFIVYDKARYTAVMLGHTGLPNTGFGVMSNREEVNVYERLEKYVYESQPGFGYTLWLEEGLEFGLEHFWRENKEPFIQRRLADGP